MRVGTGLAGKEEKQDAKKPHAGEGSPLQPARRSTGARDAGLTVDSGWGVETSDWDHNGGLDLSMRSLFTNEVASPGHWLRFRVIGNVSAKRAAIGATVPVTAGGTTRLRYVNGGTGQGCQDSMVLHYGVGTPWIRSRSRSTAGAR